MSDELIRALQGVEAIDPDQASRLLLAFTAISDVSSREDVIAFAEALVVTRSSH